MSGQLYIGIDIAKNRLDISENGNHRRINNGLDDISQMITKLPPESILVYEATGGYEHLLESMVTAAKRDDITLKRVHPSRVRAFGKACGITAKTDKIDAHLLAKFGEFDCSPERIMGSKKLLMLNRRRRQLSENLQAEKNHKSLMPPELQASIDGHILFLKCALKEIEATLNTAIAEDQALAEKKELLKSVKGVGDVTANALISTLPELGSRDKGKIASLVGVAPKTRESGKKSGYAKTGHGRSEVRKALYMAALVASRHNPIIKEFYDRLRAKGKSGKVALVACMRKLLVILNAILKTNKPWKYA